MAHLLFEDILSALKSANSPILPPDIPALKGVLGGSRCGKTYAEITVWVCNEIKRCGGEVDIITMPKNPDEENMFRVELSSVLRSLDCPLPGLNSADALTDPNNRTAALHFITHELLTTQLLALSKPQKTEVNTETGCFSGHPSLKDLAIIYNVVQLPKPGPEDEVPDIFESITYQLEKIMKAKKTAKDRFFSDPLVKYSISPEQWNKIDEVAHLMNEDYNMRFKTLLRRLELTITSFKWGKEAKEKAELIDKIYSELRSKTNDSSNIKICNVLACRSDSLTLSKTSSGGVRDNTRTKLNKMVIVGKVPDRGGRPHETRPEPEIPSWMKDKNKQQQQSRGGQHSSRGGQRYQQQPRNDRNEHGYHQNQGYHNRVNSGYQGHDNRDGGQSNYRGRGGGNNYRGGGNNYRGGGYNNRDQRNSGWGGHRNNNRRGGGVY